MSDRLTERIAKLYDPAAFQHPNLIRRKVVATMVIRRRTAMHRARVAVGALLAHLQQAGFVFHPGPPPDGEPGPILVFDGDADTFVARRFEGDWCDPDWESVNWNEGLTVWMRLPNPSNWPRAEGAPPPAEDGPVLPREAPACRPA